MDPPPTPKPNPTHLILLTCHSIYVSGPPELESSWLLAPFQKNQNEHLTFISHIHLASSLLHSDSDADSDSYSESSKEGEKENGKGKEESLLVISGGYTRKEIRKSESRGYFEVGCKLGLWGEEDLVGKCSKMGIGGNEEKKKGRIVLEEKALDSYGNLLHGIISFWREIGRWPRKITVLSHEFKRERFLELHCRALRLGIRTTVGGIEAEEKGEEKAQRGRGVEVTFLGENPLFMNERSAEFDAQKCKETMKGEMERGYRVWKEDLWGVGSVLRGKRDGRDAWGGEERALFESEEERARSEIKTRWLEGGERKGEKIMREEVIVEGVEMPWEIQV